MVSSISNIDNYFQTLGRTQAMYFCWPLHIDEQGLGGQLEPIYNSSVLIQDVASMDDRD